MGGNSQFRQIVKRVERLEQQYGTPDSDAQVKKQRGIEQAAAQFQRAQQSAKRVLMDVDATAEQLEGAMPFLDNIGMREFARLEAEKKRAEQTMQLQAQQPLIADSSLIANMIASAKDGSYYKWQEKIKAAQEADAAALMFAEPRQVPTQPTVNPNRMKAAHKLAEMNYQRQQQKMQEHRGPLPEGRRDDSCIPFPTPLDGIVRPY